MKTTRLPEAQAADARKLQRVDRNAKKLGPDSESLKVNQFRAASFA